MVWQTPRRPVVSISERLGLSPGHHACGSAHRPVRPQIEDGVVLEYIHFQHTDINNMHSCLYTELRALPGWSLKQVCGL